MGFNCRRQQVNEKVSLPSSPHLRAVYCVSVELLSGSSQQDCYSGVGVGVQGVGEQVWELGEEDGEGRMGDMRMLSSTVGEVVPAGRKGRGGKC